MTDILLFLIFIALGGWAIVEALAVAGVALVVMCIALALAAFLLYSANENPAGALLIVIAGIAAFGLHRFIKLNRNESWFIDSKRAFAKFGGYVFASLIIFSVFAIGVYKDGWKSSLFTTALYVTIIGLIMLPAWAAGKLITWVMANDRRKVSKVIAYQAGGFMGLLLGGCIGIIGLLGALNLSWQLLGNERDFAGHGLGALAGIALFIGLAWFGFYLAFGAIKYASSQRREIIHLRELAELMTDSPNLQIDFSSDHERRRNQERTAGTEGSKTP